MSDPPGGTTNRTMTNCRIASAGPWSRTSTTGYHFSASGGVKMQPYLGINLSSDTNYGSTHIIFYNLVAKGTVCGDNADPSIASNVRTSR